MRRYGQEALWRATGPAYGEDYAHISICSYADNICHRPPVFAAGASRCTHRACRRNLRGHPQGAPLPMQNDMIYGSDIHHRRSIRLKPTPGHPQGAPLPVVCWVNRIWSVALGHAVADARRGKDILGIGGAVVQLAADGFYDGAQRPQVAAIVRAPDLLQQMSVGQHAAGVACKRDQHPVLGRGQRHCSCANGNEAFGIVDCQLALDVRLRRPCLAGCGPSC